VIALSYVVAATAIVGFLFDPRGMRIYCALLALCSVTWAGLACLHGRPADAVLHFTNLACFAGALLRRERPTTPVRTLASD
jgi:hypothetical protein